jgi:SAM-dependent methyltransferase
MIGPIRGLARAGADFVDIYLYRLTTALRHAAPRAHGKLLDVGCGEKRFEPLFTPFVESYTGVEHEAVFRSTHASTRARKPDVYYDGKTLPFDAGAFDTVLSTEVLEHTPNPGHLVAEMARVLRPGGTLIVTAPFAFRLHEEPYDFHRFTPHGLSLMIGDTGLHVIETHPFGGVWSVVGHKINSYLALRLARLQALGQALGKSGHEPTDSASVRLWTLPVVAPTMASLAGLARVLDRVAPDPTESLGYLVIAERPS